MNTSVRTLVSCCALLVACSLIAAEAAKLDLKDVKCPISGGAAKEAGVAEYKGAKVYFCCMNCPEGFKKDTAKFASKANHQLVQTKQFEQKCCPLAGKPVNDEKSVTIGGVAVKFCCDGCKGKVEKATDEEKLELVFADKAFDKAFGLPKKEEKKEVKKDTKGKDKE